MCNLSDGVEAIGFERGILQGIISTCKDLGISFIDTVERVANELDITKEEAEKKVHQYWQ